MHRHLGFSLLELLIVLAIITILASFSYPSYLKQVQKSQRIEAKTALSIIAQQQEEYFLQHLSYAANLDILHRSVQAQTQNSQADQAPYQFSITQVLPENCSSDKATPCVGYTIVADADNRQSSDSQCQQIRLNHLGEQSPLVCW